MITRGPTIKCTAGELNKKNDKIRVFMIIAKKCNYKY